MEADKSDDRRHRRRVGGVRDRLRQRLEELLAPERRELSPALSAAFAASADGWLSLRELNAAFGPLLLQASENRLVEEERRSLANVAGDSELFESSGLRIRPHPRPVPREERTLFVDGLRPAVGPDWLKAQFSGCGTITAISVPGPRAPPKPRAAAHEKPRSVVSLNRGFAFLTFSSRAALQKALLLNKPSREPGSDGEMETETEEAAASTAPRPTEQEPRAGPSNATTRAEDGDSSRTTAPAEAAAKKKRSRGRSRAAKEASRRGRSDLRHHRETQGLWLLPHAEWARLKAEYLALQKAHASRLKAAIPADFQAPPKSLATPASKPRKSQRKGREQLARRAEAFRAASAKAAPHDAAVDLEAVD